MSPNQKTMLSEIDELQKRVKFLLVSQQSCGRLDELDLNKVQQEALEKYISHANRLRGMVLAHVKG